MIDTDVFVDHLRAAHRVPVPPQDAAYSSITRAELYAGRATDEAVVDALLAVFEEVAFDRSVAEAAGRIRRSAGISMADAAIAATALRSNAVLVTRNTKDFSRVAGLELL